MQTGRTDNILHLPGKCAILQSTKGMKITGHAGVQVHG